MASLRRSFRRLLILATVVVIALSLFGGKADTGIWDIFEGTVENSKKYSDPYHDVALDVIYTKPDGSKVKFWGFYDGADTWKFRFMPDQLGRWHYLAKFSDRQDAIRGSFQVASSSIPGIITAYKSNPRWFGYKGGKAELIRSFHCGNSFFNQDISKRSGFLDWAQAQGYNTLSLGSLFMSKSSQKVNKLWPLDATEYRKAETYLREFARRKLIVFPFYGFFPKASLPRNEEDQQLYIRYAVARFAPFWNLLFNVAGPEPNLSNYLPGSEVGKLGKMIAEADVFNHLLGVHNKDGDDPYNLETWNSLTVLQDEITDLGALNKYFLKNDSGRSPIYAQETLWPGNVLQPFAKSPQSSIRRHIWVHMMSAASFNNGDMNGRSSSGFSGSLALKDKVQWRHDVAKSIWNFMESVPFYRMKPCQNAISGGNAFCLGESVKHYLVYLPNGGSVNMKAPQASYQAQWISGANTAQRRSAGSVRGDERFSAPSSDDWLLELKTSGSNS